MTAILNIILKQFRTSLCLLLLLMVITGIFYPYCVTLLAQSLMPWSANGSLLLKNNKPIGSLLIGQFFSSPQYFWGRPSATQPFPYNGEASSGSNLGPSNPTFITQIETRLSTFKPYLSSIYPAVPVDLVTASGSGLDPDISPQAAFFQVPRVAAARHLAEKEIEILITKQMVYRQFWLLGEPRVNVLRLNLLLDELSANHANH